MGPYYFEQLIDIDQVRQLLESHHLLSGMAYGLFDSNENDIVSAGWQEICMRFHRVHPVCSERCRESNAFIKSHLDTAMDGYLEYRCSNGMIDVAMPIIIEGMHLATFFIGQFFYEDERPDRGFFLAQAEEFGFDPDDYLAALEQVPLFSREHVRANLTFLHSLMRILAESGLKSLALAREMDQRMEKDAERIRRVNEELNQKLDELELIKFCVDQAPVGINRVGPDGKVLYANTYTCESLGYSHTELLDKKVFDFDPQFSPEMWPGFVQRLRESGSLTFETIHQKSDGIRIPMEITSKRLEYDGKEFFFSFEKDITKRKNTERSIALLTFALNKMHESAYLIDEHARLLYVNEEASRALGYTCAELLEMGIPDIDPDFSMEIWPGMSAEIKSHGSLNLERRHKTKSGVLFPVEIYSSHFEYDGEEYNFALARDISERKRIEQAMIRQEHYQRTLLDNFPYFVWLKDTESRLLAANREYARVAGVQNVKELEGKTDFDFFPHDLAEKYVADDRTVMAGGAIKNVEEMYCDEHGERRWMETWKSPVTVDGEIVGTVGCSRDITERKQMEEERRTNLRFFESMDLINRTIQGTDNLENMMSGVLDVVLSIFTCDRAYLMYPCAPDAEKWVIPMERTTREYPGSLALGVDLSRDEHVAAKLRLLLSSDGPVSMGAGTPYPLSGTTAEKFGIRSMLAMAVYPKVGKPWEFGIHQCSCDRIWTPEEERLAREIGRRLEDALTGLLTHRDLQASEERYRRIVDTSAEGIWAIGPDAITTFVNARMAEMLGYPCEEMLGRPMLDFILDDDVPDHLARMENRRQGRSETYERRFRRRDGRTLWTLASATSVFDANNVFDGSFAMFTDITERKISEEKLFQVTERWRKTFDAVPDLIAIIDNDFKIMQVNKAMADRLGVTPEECVGLKCHTVLHGTETPPSFCPHERTLRDCREHMAEVSEKVLGGVFIVTTSPMYDSVGKLIGSVHVARDVTELRQAEEERKHLEIQFHQSQKMEAIGQLAGGIAHDFNNILTAIVGFAHLIGMKLGQESSLNSYLNKILVSAEQASSLTRDLLAFSRKQMIELKPIDFGKAIAGSKPFISRLLREDIELTISTPELSLVVLAGETQLTQILMNLTTNARDAMPTGGKIFITTSSFAMDQKYVASHGFGRIGNFAMLTFADTGCGMDEKTRARVFEPFFTTKEVGHGSGLGLATVYGIVKQLDGFISIYSEPGQGTTFKIYLPLADDQTTTQEAVAAVIPLPGGSETLLLAEDDPDVREIEESILLEAGYRVISARDGNEALRIFSERRDAIDLLILDGIMPGKNGVEVFRQALEVCPWIKAILVSGYTSEIMVVNGLVERGLKLLQKPVSPKELLQAVREILDRQELSCDH